MEKRELLIEAMGHFILSSIKFNKNGNGKHQFKTEPFMFMEWLKEAGFNREDYPNDLIGILPDIEKWINNIPYKLPEKSFKEGRVSGLRQALTYMYDVGYENFCQGDDDMARLYRDVANDIQKMIDMEQSVKEK